MLDFGPHQKQLFVSVNSVDWPTAIITCKNFGMELITSSSDAEDDILRKKLEEKEDVPDYIHVGATSMGTEDLWYRIHTGKLFNYDLEWTKEPDYYAYDSKCLRLKKRYSKFSYDLVSCMDSSSRFICQKVIDSKQIFVLK